MKTSLALLLMLGALGAAAPAVAQLRVTAAQDQAALLTDKDPQLEANKTLT